MAADNEAESQARSFKKAQRDANQRAADQSLIDAGSGQCNFRFVI